jgi:hypothetical protein
MIHTPVLSFGELYGADRTRRSNVQLFRFRHEAVSLSGHQLGVQQEHVQPRVDKCDVDGQRLGLVGLVLALDAGRRIRKF